MINQIVDVVVKPGCVWEFCKTIQDNLALWRTQPGFVDEIVMADPDANHIVAQSFWRSALDADRFRLDGFVRFTAIVEDLIAAPPTCTTFLVAVSTNRHIALETNGPTQSAAAQPAQMRAGDLAAQAMKAPPAMFISGLELVLRISRGVQNSYNDAIDGALSAASASAAAVSSRTQPMAPATASNGQPQGGQPVAFRDTLNGLIAFVVPGPDAYSLAQGVSTAEPGGLDAGIHALLIEMVNKSQPSPPGGPPPAAVVAGALNQIARQVNPSAKGPFASPFACLPFADKARVFQAIEGNPQTRALAGVLPLIAFLVYSEASMFDRRKRTIGGQPLGWRLSGYEGVADGRDDFKGYYQNRRSVETSPELACDKSLTVPVR